MMHDYSSGLPSALEYHQREARERHRLNNPVVPIKETLEYQIKEFESQLKPDEDIALWLVSFGPTLVFHANNIRFAKPGLVIFEGVTEEGQPMQLVQHHSQLNVLFKAVKKTTDEPRNPIGFVWDE